MKRILFSLAAIAALASCVKENIAVPAEGQLTISAVSADSKTVLDGLNVVWENTDKIAVVVNADTKVTADFSIVESTLNGSAADFVGTVGAFKNATSAYAVYPAAAVELTHTLPADQTTGVSGLMLSSAALDVEQMEKGAVTAVFNPALSLLQVAVPAGVKSVELTSAEAALVGPATFEVNADGSLALEPTAEATKTVVLAAEAELEAKVYPVVVYPGTVGDLTLKLVGAKGEELVKTLSNVTFNVAEARAVNLMQIFQFAPEAIEVAPNGGNIEIPFTTTVEEVTVTENADWLEASVAVKGFQTGNVCLVATANEGDATRTAEVTVSWGENKSVTFTLTQDAIYRGFLDVQWEETFGVYTSESDANAANVANATATHKNVFTISLSDDYAKGTYLVDNIFKATSYYHNGQPVSNKGGKFYANYKDGKLTILYENSVNCYGFTNDVVLAYDEVANTFSAAALKVYDYSVSRNRYIGGYAAAVKVEEPEVGGSPLAGEWNQTVVFGANSAVKTGAATTALVTVSGDQVTIENFVLDGVTATGVLSGNTITIAKANSGLPTTYGPVDNDIVITVSDDNATMTATNITSGYGYGLVVESWTAEISAPVAPSPLAGEWNQTVVFGANSAVKTGAATTALVTVSGDQVTIENFVLDGVTATGVLSGNTITIAKANSGLPTTYGPVDNDIVITVSDDNATMTATNITSGYGYGLVVESWTITKAGAVEPEQPTRQPNDSWENAAVVVNDGTDQKYGKFFKELKVYADKDNMYIRLTMEKQDAYYADIEFKSNKLDMFLANGEGDPADEATEMWWGWTTRQTAKYDEEHKGDMTGGVLTKMRFYQNPGSEEGKVYVDFTKEEVDGNYVYNFTYKREWIAPYVSSEGNIYVAYRLWNNWEEYWVIPQTGQPMLEVVLP